MCSSAMASSAPIATPAPRAPIPIIKKPRIPLELQAVFLESNRGGTVDKPPPSASKYFFQGWFGKRKESKQKKSGYVTPTPIIKGTRVPRELQNVLIESNRGGSLKQAPSSVNFTRKWFDKTKTSDKKKPRRRLLFGRETRFIFDKNLPPSHRGGEGEKDAGGGDTRWASACTQEKCNSAPRAPSRRSQGESSPHASRRGKLDADPRLLAWMNSSSTSLDTSTEYSPTRRPKQCVQMNAHSAPKRPVRRTSIGDEDD
jgi:hypothetical protein